MIFDNINNFKGPAYVCFIDVLGFSNDILTNWNKITSNPLEKIILVKDKIPGFSYNGGDDERSSLANSYIFRMNTISDSYTLCFGFKDTPSLGDLAFGLDIILKNLSYLWATFISHGYTIRGAIDYGDIYWDENELIGPAFIKAYHFESKVAKISRVVASSDLNKLLKDLFSEQTSTLIKPLLRKFRKDIDGYIIVDPMILYKSLKEKEVLVERLKKMRDEAPTGICQGKYDPLISMIVEDAKEDLKPEDVGDY